LIKDTDIHIDHIVHNQYREAYIFKRGDDFSRVDVGYNGKEKVTSLTAPHLTSLAANIKGLLEPLKGVPIVRPGDVPASQFSFDEDFLNEFHHRLIPLVEEQGMAIQNAV